MFVSLKNILSRSVQRYNLKEKINALDMCEASENIILNTIKYKVSALRCKNGTILLKVKNGTVANEIKLKEKIIKEEFFKNNLKIHTIKCII